MSHRWIDTDAGLAELVEELLAQDRYAMDTEFHRERTYFPKLALIQFAWDGGLALVDPLATDVKLLVELFESETLAVLHAAQQDLDVLTHACGTVPARMFDTQLAAGFLGYSTPSLVSLVHGELKIQLPKGDRLTDWLRRPLTEDQRDYAAADVLHLLELADLITAQLESSGRLAWAMDACEELRSRPQGPIDPELAWTKLKDAKTLKAKGKGVARAVAAWRERRAMRLDQPPRQVLPDLALLSIAQKAPRTLKDLAASRGVDDRHTRAAIAQEILDAVALGLEHPVETPPSTGDELDRKLRPAVTLVSAWVSELARRERVDTTLLATRADLVAFLRGDDDARLAHGWRAELVGDDVGRLVDGRAGLAFDRDGGLRLIPSSPA
ncbi:MAG: ribonuclease D [Ilumatobacteraceae bacterium]